MKKYFELLYWIVTTVVMSFVLTGAMGSFGDAFLFSVVLLPGIFFIKYFSKDISFKNLKTGLLHCLYFAGAAIAIEYMSIAVVFWFIYDWGEQMPEKTAVILSPLFLCFILAALLSIETLLKLKFISSIPEEKYITFTSERVKISLEIDTLIYIESMDYEVRVITTGGLTYPTRMKISQWEAVLDGRFIRVHRSFIVNRKHITRFDARAVWLGDFPVEISRKYKENVLNELNKGSL